MAFSLDGIEYPVPSEEEGGTDIPGGWLGLKAIVGICAITECSGDLFPLHATALHAIACYFSSPWAPPTSSLEHSIFFAVFAVPYAVPPIVNEERLQLGTR